MKAQAKARLELVDDLPDVALLKARSRRIEAEQARSAATLAVMAAINAFSVGSQDRSWIRDRARDRHRAFDLLRTAAGDEEVARLDAFRDAELAEVEAERRLSVALDEEAIAVRGALGDGRGRLAEAIAAARDRVAMADEARAMAARARGGHVQARMRADEAEDALRAMREDAINAATAGDSAASAKLRDVRRAAADAADDAEIAAEAVRRAEAAMEAPIAQEARAHKDVETAARAVLYADFDTRFAVLDGMVTDFKFRALTHAAWLRASVPNDGAWTAEKARDFRRADALIEHLLTLGEPIGETPYQRGEALFGPTLSALMADATAALPELP